MRNIHVLPTDKPSRLYTLNSSKKLYYTNNNLNQIKFTVNQNIYITSDEEITGFENYIWVYNNGRVWLWQNTMALRSDNKPRKIILTTDGDLIKNGVQSIDDEFLEWFVKNPSCEEAKVEITEISCIIPNFGDVDKYRIAIPKQESKTAWVGVLHDKLNEYHPAEYELKDIYQGEGCLPNFPDEELCQIWCDSQYKEVPKQETALTSEEFFRKKLKELNPLQSSVTLSREMITAEQGMIWAKEYSDYINKQEKR